MPDSQALQKYGEEASLAASLYMLGLIFVFPVYCTDRYFNILEDRFTFFWKWTATCAALILAIFLVRFCMHLREKHDAYQKALPEPHELPGVFLRSFSVADRLVLLFLAIIAISFLLSDWRREAFTGAEGRSQGLFQWCWYVAAYFIVSRHYVPKRWHLDAFLATGGLLALWGLLDYAGTDIFGWISAIKESQRHMFTSSFGNINTYTQVMSVYLAACCGSLISTPGYMKPARLLETFLFTAALITGQSDNAVIGLVTVFIFIFFLSAKDFFTYINFVYASGAATCAFFLAKVLTIASPDSPMAGFDKGLLLRISGIPGIVMYMTAASILLALPAVKAAFKLSWQRKNGLEDVKKYWKPYADMITKSGILILATGILFGIVLFFRINIVKGGQWIGPFADILVFSDTWGTHRGLVWRMAAEEFAGLPLLQKLFGTGPETFGLLMEARYDEMRAICGQVFDSPHNEALQFLVTSGILGMICFYGLVLVNLRKGLKQRMYPAAIVVFAYLTVSLVSISVPIAMPYCIIALGLCAREVNEKPISHRKSP